MGEAGMPGIFPILIVLQASLVYGPTFAQNLERLNRPHDRDHAVIFTTGA
jgi:hypothetical protein